MAERTEETTEAPSDVAVTTAPVVVLSKTFPARPSSFPEIRQFVQTSLADAPLTTESNLEVQEAVSEALLGAAGPEGAAIQVSFRIYRDHVEVDVLRGVTDGEELVAEEVEEPSFAAWMAAVLKREGLTQEAAARQLGVSVRTVNRWVAGDTEPRLRELRRIREVFGEVPFP